MKTAFLGLLTAATLAFAPVASAATLSLAGTGGSAVVLPSIFNLDDKRNGASGWSKPAYEALVPKGHGYDCDTFTAINGMFKDGTNGLSLDRRARVTFTYLGYEAGYTNAVIAIGEKIFRNKGTGASAFGAMWSGVMGPGLLDFAFMSHEGGSIANNGSAKTSGTKENIGIAYSLIDRDSAIVLFDDSGAGPDVDYDDLGLRIDVAAVPLPAGGMLLLGGLAALFATGRRRA
jgi:hypothetical protein